MMTAVVDTAETGDLFDALADLAVEVLVPSPLLATGMRLIDTPGIGSVFVGNTGTTRAFVPRIDAMGGRLRSPGIERKGEKA